MEAILLAERRTIARALPQMTFFAIVTALAYTCLIAERFGYASEVLRLPAALIALVGASLIVNTALHILDQVRYAEKYRLENARGGRLCR